MRATANGVPAKFDKLKLAPAVVPAKPLAVIVVIPEATLTAALLVSTPVPSAVVLPKVKVPSLMVVEPP